VHDAGVTFAQLHRWTGITPGRPIKLTFAVHEDIANAIADAVVLALGGASWPEHRFGWWMDRNAARTSTSKWTPFTPSNCGWEFDWPAAFLAEAEGKPLKNVVVRAGRRKPPAN
jgi:predicted flavoprotein YhiN